MWTALIWCLLVVGSPREIPEALNKMTLAKGREAKVIPTPEGYFLIIYRAEKCKEME